MKKRKIIAVVLVTMIVLTSSMSVSAEDWRNKYDEDVNYAYIVAGLFLKEMGNTVKIENPIVLENLKGEQEAVLFEIISGGYIIVNLKDLSIPELAFESKNPYAGYKNPVYNGPLNYYYRENEFYFDISGENVIIDINSVETYDKEQIENKAEYVKKLVDNDKKGLKNRTVTKYINGRLERWSYNTTGFCGATAAGICMRYYHDYVDNRYVDSLFIQEIDLIELMRGYIAREGASQEDMVIGLNRYFNHRGVNNRARHNGWMFNYNTVITCVDRSRPSIIALRNHPTYGTHWVIAWGYYNSTNRQYVIINDGHGNGQVLISVAENYMSEMVYFDR
ncbi:MAG: hypothetical protein J5749_03845 [Lachnospiraceae bacterium]|nr:hypothetical protein [Lachnospiraceae bacterium]